MHQRTLLIIDDDAAWLKIAAKFFQQYEYVVLTAATCAEGIQSAQQHRPSCILLDFHLPDMDGSWLATYVRSDVELRKTPIIMVSGEVEQEFAAHYNYQVDGFFLKGWSPERARAMVESLLRRVEWERGIIHHKDIYLDGSSSRVFRDSRLVVELSREQFRLLSVLVERSPEFVSEADISRHVFGVDGEADKRDAIRGLAHRLRDSLGTQLGHRIRSKADSGWGYVQPRERSKEPSYAGFPRSGSPQPALS